MPKHPHFDLAVLDMDGTILSADGISPAIFAAVEAVQAAGVPVTIATGRTLDDARRRGKGLPIQLPMVSTQGAVIGDFASGEILHETTMPLESARKVAAWIDEGDRVVFFYFTQPDGTTRLIQNREVWSATEYDHFFGYGRKVMTPLAPLFAQADAHPPVKFIAVNDMEQEPDIVPELVRRFEPSLHVTRSHALLVEGTHALVNKGSGLQRLLDHLRIDPKRVLAIGDNDNDLPVLRMVGTAVAMGQSKDHIKAAADWVAPSINENGAAVALRRFVLGEGAGE